MNVVKSLLEVPIVFCVVDLKAAVWRNTLLSENHYEAGGLRDLLERLDGAEVGSKDTS